MLIRSFLLLFAFASIAAAAEQPPLGKADYDFAMKFFAKEGYDTTQFRHVVQFPGQVGKPGFYQAPN